jgi:hypothetical protein
LKRRRRQDRKGRSDAGQWQKCQNCGEAAGLNEEKVQKEGQNVVLPGGSRKNAGLGVSITKPVAVWLGETP